MGHKHLVHNESYFISNACTGSIFHDISYNTVKGKMKWGHLCTNVLKLSQEAVKEMGLMHIPTRRNQELLNCVTPQIF